MQPILILVTSLALAGAVGYWLNRRDGRIRSVYSADVYSADAESSNNRVTETFTDLGWVPGQAAIVHFSAPWCAPCIAVTRNVALATANSDAADIEVDFDSHGDLAKMLGVMSLPTTFVVDGDGVIRFRAAGVPSVSDLLEALAFSQAESVGFKSN